MPSLCIADEGRFPLQHLHKLALALAELRHDARALRHAAQVPGGDGIVKPGNYPVFQRPPEGLHLGHCLLYAALQAAVSPSELDSQYSKPVTMRQAH